MLKIEKKEKEQADTKGHKKWFTRLKPNQIIELSDGSVIANGHHHSIVLVLYTPNKQENTSN